MNKIVKPVPEDLQIRANAAAANGPRGYENAMISMIKALSNEAGPDELLAISYRLQALANLTSGADVAGLTMTLHDKEYKLVNETAFRAAAVCPLRLTGTMADVKFDLQSFSTWRFRTPNPKATGRPAGLKTGKAALHLTSSGCTHLRTGLGVM